jgi:hypothetical protein
MIRKTRSPPATGLFGAIADGGDQRLSSKLALHDIALNEINGLCPREY